MPDEKRYYKTLSTVQGRLYSASVRGKYRIEYLINQWVTTTLPPLFVFDTLEAARAFCKPKSNRVIYACEIGDIIPIPIMIPDPDQPNFDEVLPSWRQYGESYSWSAPQLTYDTYWSLLPEHSVGTDRVRLIAKIW